MLKTSDRIVWIEDGRITKVTTPEDMKIQIEEIR
jgi:ABC-type Fe3+/spermidine/putrescine transport system ATPase subunit